MRILLVTETLNPGGAELFVLRLSNALQVHGNEVSIFSFYKKYYNYQMHMASAPNVTVTHASIPLNLISQKFDSLFRILKWNINIRNAFIRRSLRRFIENYKPDVVHSNLFKADLIAASVSKAPVVITIHGDYLELYKPHMGEALRRMLRWESNLLKMLKQVSKIICISEEQLSFFANRFDHSINKKIAKIYNGYPAIKKYEGDKLRDQLHISPSGFVFGMVSRGQASKGWQVAIDAFIQLNCSDCHLVFVGDGKYLNLLKKQFFNYPTIHFIGHSNCPLDWINIFDVGLLPSYSEGLPTVVIEYLYCGKPVIASEVGETPRMLRSETGSCGITIPVVENAISVKAFSDAMFKLKSDASAYNDFKRNTKNCFEKFNMAACVSAYEKVYKDATSE